jgi:hypothetical protein
VRVHSVRPVYVEFIPKVLEHGLIYISQKYRTASHLCCCGCGTKIVTPLRETEYSLVVRGGAVSLFPSIGNWNYPCQSHYWIRANRILWAEPMSREAIRTGRAHDDAAKEAYFVRLAWPWWRRLWSEFNRMLRDLFRSGG